MTINQNHLSSLPCVQSLYLRTIPRHEMKTKSFVKLDIKFPESSESRNSPRGNHLRNLTETPGQQDLTLPSNMASTPSTSPNGLDPARTGLEPIIREIEDRKSGRSPYNFQPWLVFSLTPADLRALDNHFQGDLFWETKLR